ncbi:EpsG family protein [Aeromonas sp. FDAARGOS 1408]|uniref:EpsG family protein n=1 Tax=Aeromonas TaxID=642 RepID=UPI001C218975|nr:EpsG family protein [Aeromonas sp. FDAARGOS 1408]QXC06444.1 EpsG family protein [Aeromonas sp. FDAARGOS 1408]
MKYIRIDNDFLFFILAYFGFIVFSLVSFGYASTFEVKGDTLQYFYNFESIKLDPFPYGFEFVTSGIMWLVNFLGGDFRLFLFVCLFMWSPIVFIVILLSRRNPMFIFIYLFFLTPIFMSNALYIIRQYHAALFFIMFIYLQKSERKIKIASLVLFLVSFCSHLSAILWFSLSRQRVVSLFVKPFFIYTMAFTPFFLLLINVNSISVFVDALIEISNFFGASDINRKLAFYTTGEYLLAEPIGYQFIFISAIIIILSVYLMLYTAHENTWVFLMFTQSLLLVTLKDNIIIANRFAFFSYYFSMPSLLILISLSLRGIKWRFN